MLHDAGLPEELSYGIAFALALILVTFLHMVVGEMAPKSWAITDPQRSALLLALPFRRAAGTGCARHLPAGHREG